MLLYLSVPIGLYGTVWILMLAYSYRFATTTRLARAGFLQIHRELEEASAASGGAGSATQRRCPVPLMLPALASGFILLFIVGVREFTIPLVLYSQDNVVLSVLLWQLFQYGQPAPSAALATIIIAIVVPVCSWRGALPRRPVCRGVADAERDRAVAKRSDCKRAQFQAVDGVSFHVAQGQCYALLGPSGCGKTTALRCIAGLEQAERGRIEIGGRSCRDTGRGCRSCRCTSARSAWCSSPTPSGRISTCSRTSPIRCACSARGWPRAEIERARDGRAGAGRHGADGTAGPHRACRAASSSAWRSRARSSASRPLLLLDEPLSNLDARLRETMRNELSGVDPAVGVTALFVTHDQVEAFAIADRVAVMNEGRIVQEGAPSEIYDRPSSLFVARFLGAANILAGRVEAREARDTALIVLDGSGHRVSLVTDCQPGEAVDVVLRPEHVALSTTLPADSLNAIPGRVTSLAFQGGHVEYDIDLEGGGRARAHALSPVQAQTGQPVWITVDAGRGPVFRRTVGAARH